VWRHVDRDRGAEERIGLTQRAPLVPPGGSAASAPPQPPPPPGKADFFFYQTMGKMDGLQLNLKPVVNAPYQGQTETEVVQHLAEGFTPGLLRWFSQALSIPVELARDGTACKPGHVYLPPDGHDLELDAHGVFGTPRSTGVHRPSGNRMLQSLARSCGARAGGMVLTGMGDDGAQGLLAIRDAGGVTFAQDEATSGVYGMPQVAVACGATSTQLPLEGLASAILRHGGTVGRNSE